MVSEAWRRSGTYLLASTTIETTLITGGRPQIPLFIRRFLVRIPGGGRGHPRSSPSTASTGACSEEKFGGAGTTPDTSRVALVPTTASSPEQWVNASSTRPGHRQANHRHSSPPLLPQTSVGRPASCSACLASARTFVVRALGGRGPAESPPPFCLVSPGRTLCARRREPETQDIER